jgi:hypothetical protein
MENETLNLPEAKRQILRVLCPSPVTAMALSVLLAFAAEMPLLRFVIEWFSPAALTAYASGLAASATGEFTSPSRNDRQRLKKQTLPI